MIYSGTTERSKPIRKDKDLYYDVIENDGLVKLVASNTLEGLNSKRTRVGVGYFDEDKGLILYTLGENTSDRYNIPTEIDVSVGVEGNTIFSVVKPNDSEE